MDELLNNFASEGHEFGSVLFSEVGVVAEVAKLRFLSFDKDMYFFDGATAVEGT